MTTEKNNLVRLFKAFTGQKMSLYDIYQIEPYVRWITAGLYIGGIILFLWLFLGEI